jgi:hypothetical protein
MTEDVVNLSEVEKLSMNQDSDNPQQENYPSLLQRYQQYFDFLEVFSVMLLNFIAENCFYTGRST